MDKAELWKKVKKVICTIGVVLSIPCLLFSVGKLFISDIPAIITGYEEIVTETVEDEDWMGRPTTRPSQTAKKAITFEDALGRIVDRLAMGFMSGTVLILGIFNKDEYDF